MEKTNREIRALLSSMAPARAAQAVRLVGLPPDEEAAVLAVDVHGQSCLQAAALLHVSVDGLAKIRRRAYAKIADDMQGQTKSRVRFGHGSFYIFSSAYTALRLAPTKSADSPDKCLPRIPNSPPFGAGYRSAGQKQPETSQWLP